MRIASIICLTFTILGCSESSTQRSPTTPTPAVASPPPTSGSASCRTYPTAATVTMTRGALTQTGQLTGSFNASANTATVTVALANEGLCSTSESRYRSTEDFVDEVRVIPGLTMQTSTTTTFSGACDSGTATVDHVYDSQRRLVSSTTRGDTTTYTVWDSAGRPTAGSSPGTTIENTYDNSTRTVQTQTRGAATSTTTVTYDGNGAQTSIVYTAGGVTTTTTFNTTATGQVCK